MIPPPPLASGCPRSRLSSFAVDQDTRTRASKAGTSTAKKLLHDLRLQYMRPVARMVRARFPDDEALLRKLSLSKQRDAQGPISAAEAMADTAARDEIRRGGHIVRLIDAMVRPAPESNPSESAEWLTLIRRRRVGSGNGGGLEGGEGVARAVGATVDVNIPRVAYQLYL